MKVEDLFEAKKKKKKKAKKPAVPKLPKVPMMPMPFAYLPYMLTGFGPHHHHHDVPCVAPGPAPGPAPAPAPAPPVTEEWHDSDAPKAEGKFRDLGVNDLADWLIKTRGGDMQKINGALQQQITFNKKDDPAYAKKMESVRATVKRKLNKD